MKNTLPVLLFVVFGALALAASGETPAAFGRRCIPADCVAPPSHIDDMLGRRALSAGRLAALGATLDFHHGLLGAQSAPVAETGPRAFQFESVKQGDPVSHSFVLRNRSDLPLRILALDLTPGLRLARMPAQIPPGEQVDLNVSIDTAGLSGEYEGQLKVHVNDAARSVLVFDVTGSVTPPVEFRPYAALFVVGQRGKRRDTSAEGSIEIVNHQERPLRFTRIEYPEDRFTTRLDELDAGQRYRLTLTLHPNGPAGRHQDVILLPTTAAGFGSRRIPGCASGSTRSRRSSISASSRKRPSMRIQRCCRRRHRL